MTGRILAIGLDGYEYSLAHSMMAGGLLPHMRALRSRASRFVLDHGAARYSGLAWEHVSAGLSPERMRRWSAVNFDPQTYRAVQTPTTAVPFTAAMRSRSLVFDMPYCDLAEAPNTLGLTRWGAHDPGVAPQSCPDGLHGEIDLLFGPYPAADHIYGVTWPSAGKTRKAAAALEQAVKLRARVAAWLLTERLPDWDLAMVVISEAHSAIEQMWHGIDPCHDLRGVPSAAIAREGLRSIYSAIDDMLGALAAKLPDALLVLFAMHGMGSNNADLTSMVFLSELLFRRQFGKPFMRPLKRQSMLETNVPDLADRVEWHRYMAGLIPPLSTFETPESGPGKHFRYRQEDASPIDWMPAARYRPFWPQMDAFALPSFYDGRVRINLVGREAQGRVRPQDYSTILSDIRSLVAACRDRRTDESIVEAIVTEQSPPQEIGTTQADLYIHWKGTPVSLVHPQLGKIGPLPYRRTGGHTKPHGFAFVCGPGWPAGDHGMRDSLDIVPTLVAALGEPMVAAELSGEAIDPALLAMPPAPDRMRRRSAGTDAKLANLP